MLAPAKRTSVGLTRVHSFRGTFSVREKLENLIKVGYLEDSVQLGSYRSDHNLAVACFQLSTDVQEQPQHLRREKFHSCEVEYQLVWLIYVNKFLYLLGSDGYSIHFTD